MGSQYKIKMVHFTNLGDHLSYRAWHCRQVNKTQSKTSFPAQGLWNHKNKHGPLKSVIFLPIPSTINLLGSCFCYFYATPQLAALPFPATQNWEENECKFKAEVLQEILAITPDNHVPQGSLIP